MFHTRDLLATTAVIALTIAIANASVAYRGTGLPTLALAAPLLITALVHWRFALDWRVATGIHYPLANFWAFGFGVAFSIAWRRVPKTLFEGDSVGLDTGLYDLGGARFLELPATRWPNIPEDTSATYADECILHAANSIATIGQTSFFGSAGHCIDSAESSLRLGGVLADMPFEKQLTEQLCQDRASDG